MITIKVNAAGPTSVLIDDIGVLAVKANPETYTRSDQYAMVRGSQKLLTLATDNFYGANSSTIIINDGTSDLSTVAAERYILNLGIPTPNSWFGSW